VRLNAGRLEKSPASYGRLFVAQIVMLWMCVLEAVSSSTLQLPDFEWRHVECAVDKMLTKLRQV